MDSILWGRCASGNVFFNDMNIVLAVLQNFGFDYKIVTKVSQNDHKVSLSCLQVVAKWSPKGCQVVAKRSQVVLKVVSKWSSRGQQLGIKWLSSGLQVVSKWSKSGRQVATNWSPGK